MTILKWLGGLIATLAIVLLLAILIIPRVVDPNDYREKITSIVKQETGRDLELAGDLTVSVFPWLGIRTQQLSVSQPEEIGGDMVSVDTAQIRVKLLPLVSSRLEIDTVILEEPIVRLITLKNGISSFTGLTDEAPADGAAPTAAPDEASTAVALVIQGLELTNGSLLWDDRQANQSYQVNGLNLVTGNLIGDDFADLNASGQIIDSASPDPIDFELQGEARIDTETLQISAQNIETKIAQAAQILNLTLSALTVDQVTGISVDNLGVDVTASLKDEATGDAQAVALTSVVPSFAFNSNSGEISSQNIAVNGKYGVRGFALDIPSIKANMQTQKAQLNAINLTSDDLKLMLANLSVTQFIDKPSANGRLEVAPFNAAKLLSDFEIDYTPVDTAALQSVGFKTSFNGSTQSAELSELELSLDKSTLSGSTKITDFENMAVVFDLVLDQLNLDSYLPQEEAGAEDVEAAVSGAEALAVPMAALQGINANGQFKAQQLISGGLELNDIDVAIVSTGSTLTITPKAKLYDGSIGGDIQFVDNDGVSSLSIKNNIDLVSLGKMLNAADVSDQLSGIGTLGIDLQVSEREGVQTNEGTIKLFAKNGALKGINVKKMLDTAYQQYSNLKGRDDEPEQSSEGEGESVESDETKFAELLGTFYLKDNRLTNNDFSMKAPLFRISGAGDIDLGAESINYLVNVSVVASSSGQGGAALDELAGITIPIRLKGDLTAPGYSIDMKALLSGLAKKELKGKKDQFLKEKFGVSLSGDVDDDEDEEPTDKDSLKKDLKKKLLKGLFN